MQRFGPFWKKARGIIHLTRWISQFAEQRAVYDRMCAAFDLGRPEGVRVEDRTLAKGAVPFLHTANVPQKRRCSFCHGGGFVVGGLDSHDSVCAEFCARTGLRVVAVDYRMSPEHPHPDDFDDAWAAFRSVAEQVDGPDRVCAATAQAAILWQLLRTTRAGRLDGRIAGQLLIYPGLGRRSPRRAVT